MRMDPGFFPLKAEKDPDQNYSMGVSKIMWIVWVVIGGALVGAFAGIVVVIKNRTTQLKLPIDRVEATVVAARSEIKMMNQNFTSGTVDSAGAYESKQYYVDYKIKGGKKLSFRMKKKDWLKHHDGDKGILVYQGTKWMAFEALADQ